MKKTLILTAAFACAAFTANAALVSSWVGDVWSYAEQPNYATDLTIHAAGSAGGTLVSNVAPTSTNPEDPSAQLLNGVFYSFFASPTLTGNIDTILPDLQQIIVEITYAGGLQLADFGLSFNGDSTVYNPFSHETIALEEPVQTPIAAFDGYQYTAIWNIAALNLENPIDSIQFALPMGKHIGLVDITVTQVAVPEPSTYALIAGGFGLAAVVVARRRRRA